MLNAKYHQREAEIVAGAGQPGAVTIATNMAGRGTDIKLGGGVTDPKPSKVKDPDGKEINIMEIGGLHIVGSERHESRRIDRQLRGRAGRQGDPGATQFFLSLEDDLMRLFGSERIASLMDRLGAQEGEVLTHSLITRSIEGAQKRVELQNFQARKRLLDYDDVMNQQREVIYSLRSFALEGGEELKGEALKMIDKAITHRVDTALAEYEETAAVGLRSAEAGPAHALSAAGAGVRTARTSGRSTSAGAQRVAVEAAKKAFWAKLESLDAVRDEAGYAVRRPPAVARHAQRAGREVEGPSLRSRPAAQRDPLSVVGTEGSAHRVQAGSVHDVRGSDERHLQHVHASASSRCSWSSEPAAPRTSSVRLRTGRRSGTTRSASSRTFRRTTAQEPRGDGHRRGALDIGPAETPASKPVAARKDPMIVGAGRTRSLSDNKPPADIDWSTVGRNDPCPCGSGKKFKKCHGANLLR